MSPATRQGPVLAWWEQAEEDEKYPKGRQVADGAGGGGSSSTPAGARNRRLLWRLLRILP